MYIPERGRSSERPLFYLFILTLLVTGLLLSRFWDIQSNDRCAANSLSGPGTSKQADMPWHVSKSDSCPKSKPWAVITDETGKTHGCHATRAEAAKQMAVLYIKQKEGEIASWEEEMQAVTETARDFPAGERKKLAKEGHAMPDGSFPIKTKQDLKNAIRLAGRAKNASAARAHIKKRAKALGAEDMIPDSWK